MTQQQEIIFAKIAARKKELAGKVLILCHHYQQEDVFQFADLTGDSLKLAREAAESGKYPYIIFCGVHFMAESADILTDDDQAVILPDLNAGCPMADMATVEQVAAAWNELEEVCGGQTVIPVTYVNSSARIKAFVGNRGGSVCTSSNAERVLSWAWTRGEKVFFFPDEHLGRNSSKALGVNDEEIVVWQRGRKLGGNSVEQLKKARTILWNGYCHVHQEFLVEQIDKWRRKIPAIRIIVHPESPWEVVRQADYYGSTERIIEAVRESEAGAVWAIGTEVNLVNRLKKQHPDKTIHLLAPTPCTCGTMSCITPANLLWVLDNLAQGKVVNQITVDEQTAVGAKLALDRMLEI
ncbi:MAG: quinolinate synthase NadA [Desulfobulbaceae bacterium]|nr:quinolinate synthase NadA [Desulfobulbaceae bacterium]